MNLCRIYFSNRRHRFYGQGNSNVHSFHFISVIGWKFKLINCCCSSVLGASRKIVAIMSGNTKYLFTYETETWTRSVSSIKWTTQFTGTIFTHINSITHNNLITLLLFKIFTQLFDTIRKEKPNELRKVTPICGDITLHQLGISESDQALLCRNVSVVFHSAATVKFDEKLELSVKINMLGTKRLVELCHRMMNLDVSGPYLFLLFSV